MANQMMFVPQQDNTLRNAVLLLLALAVVWFVVLPMLRSSTAKAVTAVANAKVACDKAAASHLDIDRSAARTAINNANALLVAAASDEKAKGLALPSAELAKANADLAALACNAAVLTGEVSVLPDVVPPGVVPPGVVPPGVVPPGVPSGGKPVQSSHWRFYQGLDSGDNDIGNFPGTLDQMKATCLSLPNCVGFNDNGWMKGGLAPYTQWSKRFDDPTKGFRVLLDRVPNPPSGGVLEGFF